MTRFVSGATTVQFNQDPQRPANTELVLRQLRGFDSSGDLYVQNRSSLQRGRYRLVFNRASDAVVSDLLSFVQNTVVGIRHSFTWYDHADTARTVRLAEPSIEHRIIGPNRNQVEIELTEDL